MTTNKTTFAQFATNFSQANDKINTMAGAIEQAGAQSPVSAVALMFVGLKSNEGAFVNGVIGFHVQYSDFKKFNKSDRAELVAGLTLQGLANGTIRNYLSNFMKLLNGLINGKVTAKQLTGLAIRPALELCRCTFAPAKLKEWKLETTLAKGVKVEDVVKLLRLKLPQQQALLELLNNAGMALSEVA